MTSERAVVTCSCTDCDRTAIDTTPTGPMCRACSYEFGKHFFEHDADSTDEQNPINQKLVAAGMLALPYAGLIGWQTGHVPIETVLLYLLTVIAMYLGVIATPTIAEI